jgi:hypothetical protein
MNTLNILIVDIRMAFGTGGGNLGFGLVRQADVVDPMTIGADRGLQITLRKGFVVDAIQALGIIFKMALLADFILTDAVLPAAADIYNRVRVAGDAVMTIGAIEHMPVH